MMERKQSQRAGGGGGGGGGGGEIPGLFDQHDYTKHALGKGWDR